MKATITTLTLLACCAAAAPADLACIQWEGEDFDGGHNLGGYSLGLDPCTNASAGFMLNGLDWPGEYVDYHIDLPCDCDYAPFICAQGFLTTSNTLSMTFIARDATGARTQSLFTFEGEGYGCGAPFNLYPGSVDLPGTAGAYTVRVELVTSNAVWIDYLRLEYDDTPAGAGSWSLLRELY